MSLVREASPPGNKKGHSKRRVTPRPSTTGKAPLQLATVQPIDHGFSRTRRPACDALMETNQDCFAASAMRHVRADDTRQERQDSDSDGSEQTADED